MKLETLVLNLRMAGQGKRTEVYRVQTERYYH